MYKLIALSLIIISTTSFTCSISYDDIMSLKQSFTRQNRLKEMSIEELEAEKRSNQRCQIYNTACCSSTSSGLCYACHTCGEQGGSASLFSLFVLTPIIITTIFTTPLINRNISDENEYIDELLTQKKNQ